jgi:hypothetical protein
MKVNGVKMKLKIDIGASYTKVQLDDKEPFKFSTAIRELEKIDGFNLNMDTIDYKDSSYIVGKVGSSTLLSRDLNFFKEYSPLLIFKALQELNIDNTDEISLHIGFSYLYVNDFKQIVENIKCFEVNGHKYCFKDIKVFIQGQGIYNFLGYKGTVAIYDIGFHTNDLLIFEDGLLTTKESDKNGIIKIVTDLKNELNYKFKLELTEQQTNDILQSKSFIFEGEKVDVSELCNKLVSKYKTKTVSDLKTKFGSQLSICNNVIVSGGGSYFFEANDLPKGTALLKDEYANVKGYMV